MWDVILSIIQSPAGSFAFVVGILFLCGWIIHKVTKMTVETSDKMKGIDKLESKVDSMDEKLRFIKTKFDVLLSILPQVPGGLTESHSPIGLNEKGREIAAQMGVEQMIASNWEHIYDYIEENAESKNAYDLQQLCIETATICPERFFDKDTMDKIKMFAFNSGQSVAFYGSMIGVLIRDHYFKLKGIPIGDVDANDPNK